MCPIRAPYLPPEKIQELVDEFLDEHHRSRNIPVPIEQIVEFKFDIEIIPEPGLMGQYQIDASISHDLSIIYVDEGIYNTRSNRYRFSLAHELAHRVLHPQVFQQLEFSTIPEFKAAIGAIPGDQYRWLEHHANEFAGRVLVPSNELATAFESAENSAEQAGITLSQLSPRERLRIEDSMAAGFEVSRDVISIRLQREGLWPG